MLTEIDFRDIFVYSKKPNQDSLKAEASEFTLAVEFVVLCLFYIFVSQLMVIAYLMIAKIGGDIYIIGIILALAEATAAIVSG